MEQEMEHEVETVTCIYEVYNLCVAPHTYHFRGCAY